MKSNQKRLRNNIDCHFGQAIWIGRGTYDKQKLKFYYALPIDYQ